MNHSTAQISQLSAAARRAVQAGDWATVNACTRRILKLDKKNPEGYFLYGLVKKAAGQTNKAMTAFLKVIKLDARRYDAAIELASLYAASLRHREALSLLQKFEPRLDNSPIYLDMAAKTYSGLGMHARAWPLYQKANELQPGIDMFQANLAANAVLLGKIEAAQTLYSSLLTRHPNHQKNHYELSRLASAKDSSHVEQMQEILDTTGLTEEKNIFMYYAIGKELEDLQRWEESFQYYKMAGDAVNRVSLAANYDVSMEIESIDKIIDVCNTDWLEAGARSSVPGKPQTTPIFIVGLPRTGTTLTERIIASHSQVESADETFFMEMMIKRAGGVESREDMNPAIIEAAAKKGIGMVNKGYLEAVDYRLDHRPMFIDKYPLNFLYLGFIAKAFPQAKLIHLHRNPMDACFAIYKQSFFRFAYTLENLGRYYVAYHRLCDHWRKVLKDRLIEVQYESLVTDPASQIQTLLDKLGLEFEQACLDFHLNETPSATASTIQVREKVHTRSVGKWKNFASQLQPLKEHLENAGICVQ